MQRFLFHLTWCLSSPKIVFNFTSVDNAWLDMTIKRSWGTWPRTYLKCQFYFLSQVCLIIDMLQIRFLKVFHCLLSSFLPWAFHSTYPSLILTLPSLSSPCPIKPTTIKIFSTKLLSTHACHQPHWVTDERALRRKSYLSVWFGPGRGDLGLSNEYNCCLGGSSRHSVKSWRKT